MICQTPMPNCLEERLEVFERGLVAFLCACTEVFIETLVGCLPGLSVLAAQFVCEVLTQKWVGVDRSRKGEG